MPAQPRTAAAILASMGKAGARLDHIGACEAGAGNISVFSAGLPPDLLERFPQQEQLKLPVPAPELAGPTSKWIRYTVGSPPGMSAVCVIATPASIPRSRTARLRATACASTFKYEASD